MRHPVQPTDIIANMDAVKYLFNLESSSIPIFPKFICDAPEAVYAHPDDYCHDALEEERHGVSAAAHHDDA